MANLIREAEQCCYINLPKMSATPCPSMLSDEFAYTRTAARQLYSVAVCAKFL